MDNKQKLGHQHDSSLGPCPLRVRCNCHCQAKMIETPVQTNLFIADFTLLQTTLVPTSKDRSKFLKHSQRHLIASAVKVAPLQNPGKLFRNVQNSPTKEIDVALQKSLVLLVREARSVLYCLKELLFSIQSAAWRNWQNPPLFQL